MQGGFGVLLIDIVQHAPEVPKHDPVEEYSWLELPEWPSDRQLAFYGHGMKPWPFLWP
jgi:hypothetical protein